MYQPAWRGCIEPVGVELRANGSICVRASNTRASAHHIVPLMSGPHGLLALLPGLAITIGTVIRRIASVSARVGMTVYQELPGMLRTLI